MNDKGKNCNLWRVEVETSKLKADIKEYIDKSYINVRQQKNLG